MATVTEIREFRGVISLWIDGSFGAKIKKKHFALRPLTPGDEVDFDAWLDAVSASQADEAYEAALTSLDYAARTARDLERTLKEKGYAPPCALAVVERLQANRLLDDARYAQRVAENNVSRPIGAFAVRRKLMAKGISQEDAEAAMEPFDEAQQAEAALKAARSLRRKYEGLPEREARAKMSQALARRGFSWDAVSAAVEKLSGDEWD